jgi:hypothetical protein
MRNSPGFQWKLKETFWLSDEVSQITQSKSSFLNDYIYYNVYGGAETRSQTFQFLLDILNKNQVVEQVSTDI